EARPDGSFALGHPERKGEGGRIATWILVFDIDMSARQSPNRLVIQRVIATDAAAMGYFALEVAPQAAVAEGAASTILLQAIRRRLAVWWPELAPSDCPPRSR